MRATVDQIFSYVDGSLATFRPGSEYQGAQYRYTTGANQLAMTMSQDTGFADQLRGATHALHTRAERTGIIADVLAGRADRFGYVMLLRNLLPVYEELEARLERHCGSPGVRYLALPELRRAGPIRSDLEALAGAGWRRSVPVLSGGRRYAEAVRAAGAGRGARLIAHAYTRYLGDLNGGQTLRRLLQRRMGLDESGLSFYEFPGVRDLGTLRRDYRRAIDLAAAEAGEHDAVVEEAVVAFRHNIEISTSILTFLNEPR